MKICPKCKIGTDFYKNKAQKSGLSVWCKVCDRAQVKVWKKANKVRLHKEFYDFLNQFKNKPCKDCNQLFPSCVMDFDHLDPTTKVINVGLMMGYPKDSIIQEINKCDLVCANCHKVRTFNRYRKEKELQCSF